MKQSVKRKTLAGTWTDFTFTKKARRYFVKNYTSGDIYVSFANNDDEAESFKIKTGMGEEVAITYAPLVNDDVYTDKIYVKGTGEVEVEQLDY